ncbi:hypothetical protein [Bradyrhizobium sp. WSM1743]|uniref:hypothetical protein n=1 Tax=Bradyrhizobium sp. WSM1743 TaxID=318996 RepID=UPI0012ECB0E8|nr:hypothetical protein [Bradyrhizobium sp. WSM1743]
MTILWQNFLRPPVLSELDRWRPRVVVSHYWDRGRGKDWPLAPKKWTAIESDDQLKWAVGNALLDLMAQDGGIEEGFHLHMQEVIRKIEITLDQSDARRIEELAAR